MEMNGMSAAALLEQLQECIRADGFQYAGQPIYDEQTGGYTAAELLVRMPGRTPGEFVPLAEREGLAGELDLLVLRHALEVLERLAPPEHIRYLGVNLSPLTLADDGWRARLFRLLEEHQALCARLCFEVTETALKADLDQVAPAMERLSALGCTLAIDDFGAGQSTIQRCMDLPFHVVKLDKSLTDRLDSPKAAAFLQGIVKVLRRMGWDIVAEGVETEEQYRTLLRYGCTRFQGYYFSQPIPEAEWLEGRIAGKAGCRLA